MKPAITKETFPLSDNEEGRLFEFPDSMSRTDLNARILGEDTERPWVHATSEDLMEFVRTQAALMRERGLKYARNFKEADDPAQDLVVAMGSTGEEGPACHKLFGSGWNLAWSRTGQWGGEGTFFLAKRPAL